MRARARAEARATGLFDLIQRPRSERSRSAPARRARPAPLPVTVVDADQARAACAPMGRLETIVQSADVTGRVRALYVIVPDPRVESHYDRLGFALEPGCRVLLDAATLLPIAALRLTSCAHAAEEAPPPGPASAGFNPYHDMPAA